MGVGTVTLLSPEGKLTDVPVDQAGAYFSQGFKSATDADVVGTNAKDARVAGTSAVEALGQSIGRTVTLGGTDALQTAIGGDQARRFINTTREAHSTADTLGTVVGAIAPALLTGGESLAASLAEMTPIGRASELGSGIARLGEGAGTLGKIGYKAAGAAAEGGLIGAGQGVSEIALDDRPITWERAASAISSNALFGAAAGGALGAVGGTVEAGLGKAKGMLDDVIAKRAAQPAVSADLAELDLKGLTKARQTELDAIETARVPQRQQLADDLASFRQEVKDQKLWMATKGAENADVRVIGKQTLKADRQLDSLLDNPKALAENPRTAMRALQQQEHALENLSKKADELRASFAADQTGVRAQALDNVPGALEKNRALQARIKGLVAEPTSERLAAIQDARDVLQSGGPKKSIAEEMMGGTIFHKTSELAGGIAGSIPLAGGLIGPLAGGLAARAVTNAVFGRLAKATTAQLQKTASAVQMFAGGVGKATRASVPLATKVLSRVSFGDTPSGVSDGVKGPLAKAFAERSAELRNLTYYDETGTPRIRPEARQAMADRISPIRHVAPVAADKIETNGVRRIETYAQMMPRLPDVGAPAGGPDTRRPSDFAMRGWARVIAAGENPAGFEHRAAAGKITPEEIEAYKRIHPERAKDFVSQVLQEVAQRPSKLPYQRRLTLSMVTGAPIDPAMHPAVMTVLQGMFRAEPGSQGGTMAPKPAPQFGSVKKSVPQPTPAQKRGQGA